jgi:hypothetical protein
MYIVSNECSGIDCSGAVVTSSFPGRSMVVYHFGKYKKAQKECSYRSMITSLIQSVKKYKVKECASGPSEGI